MNWPIPFTPQHWEVGSIYRTLQVRKQRLRELPSTLPPCPRNTTQPASVLWVFPEGIKDQLASPHLQGHISCSWASRQLVSHLIWAEGCSRLLLLGSRFKASQQLLSSHCTNLFPSPLCFYILSVGIQMESPMCSSRCLGNAFQVVFLTFFWSLMSVASWTHARTVCTALQPISLVILPFVEDSECTRWFIFVNLSHLRLYDNPMMKVLSPPFYSWENWGSDTERDLCDGEAEIQNQTSLAPKSHFVFPSLHGAQSCYSFICWDGDLASLSSPQI